MQSACTLNGKTDGCGPTGAMRVDCLEGQRGLAALVQSMRSADYLLLLDPGGAAEGLQRGSRFSAGLPSIVEPFRQRRTSAQGRSSRSRGSDADTMPARLAASLAVAAGARIRAAAAALGISGQCASQRGTASARESRESKQLCCAAALA